MRSIILSLFYLSTLYLTRCDASKTEPKIFEGNITDNDVTETQHATCKIVTEEIVANARATVTRVLTGSCNAKTIDDRFRNLEQNLMKELNDIKELLNASLRNGKDASDNSKFTDNEPRGETTRNMQLNYRPINGDSSPRQEEIDKLNGTVQEILVGDERGRAFVYYWEIKDFDVKLGSWRTARSERSSTFYTGPGGYAMYMKTTPRYFPDGTVFVGVGLTRGRHDSVLEWPFPLKIRLEVLDHSPEESRRDRRSRIWDPATLCSEYFWGRPRVIGDPDNPECVGLSISRQVLFAKPTARADHRSRTTRYIWNGSITIKLTIYF